MRNFGFDWEAHKVKTDDGYILTTFHVVVGLGRPGAKLIKAPSSFNTVHSLMQPIGLDLSRKDSLSFCSSQMLDTMSG